MPDYTPPLVPTGACEHSPDLASTTGPGLRYRTDGRSSARSSRLAETVTACPADRWSAVGWRTPRPALRSCPPNCEVLDPAQRRKSASRVPSSPPSPHCCDNPCPLPLRRFLPHPPDSDLLHLLRRSTPPPLRLLRTVFPLPLHYRQSHLRASSRQRWLPSPCPPPVPPYMPAPFDRL